MSETAPEASIIIRCLNEAGYIGRLFEGLKEQTFRDFEIVVVDSGSTDGTLEIVQQQEDVNLLRIAKQDFSFGRSLNMGCEAASGRYLVAISAHCYPVDQFWLENLLDDFTNGRVGVVYGRQRGHEDSHFSEHRIFEKWFPDRSVTEQQTPFMNNANAAFRRDLWERIRFEEELPGLEDIAFARAAMGEGYRINYRADATVIHVHHEPRAQTRNRYRREAIALQHLFPEEHFNLWDFVRLYMSNVVKDAKRAAGEGRLADEFGNILGFRFAQFWGAYQGFHTRWPASSSLKRHLYYPDKD